MPRFLTPFEQGQLEPAASTLVIRPPDSAGLPGFEALTLEQGFFPTAESLSNAGYKTTPLAEGRFGMVIVNLTRSRAENMFNLARAAAMSTGLVVVNGHKTDGIESLLKSVKKIHPVEAISKAHGKVFWFNAGPMPEDWLARGGIARNEAGFLTAPGMFSYEKADAGSKLLAPYLQGLKGRVADLGAGWGWLSAQVLESGPQVAEIALYEAEHKALEAARLNIKDSRANFIWADVLSLPRTDPFDVVVTNPPFHQGRAAQPEIGLGFIDAAADMLKPKGRLLMVANRQLPYERRLQARFRKLALLAQTNGFKLFEASAPKR